MESIYKPTIALLLPNYNNGKYLTRCFNSFIDQIDFINEIIVIDDGSKDNSCNIIQIYKNKYSDKIQFFSRDNKGLILTRRELIDASSSDYLMFIDTDDYLSKNSIIEIYSYLQILKPDILAFSLRKVFSNGKYYKYDNPFHTNTILPSLIPKKKVFELISSSYNFNNLVTKVIKSNLYKRDKFDYARKISPIGEDLLQLLYPVTKAKNIYYIHKHYYNYFQNSDSMINSKRMSFLHLYNKEIWTILEKYVDEWNVSKGIFKKFYLKVIIRILSKNTYFFTLKKFIEQDFKIFFTMKYSLIEFLTLINIFDGTILYFIYLNKSVLKCISYFYLKIRYILSLNLSNYLKR
jgi:glycosyltransferase involved in cell wall biosynthesis